jgi:hypothetical protein
MTKVLETLEFAIQLAKDTLYEAEKARDLFLQPILDILGAVGGGISEVYQSKDWKNVHVLEITREGSHRGCSWSKNYSFPIEIFESDNPIEAAKKFVEQKTQEKASEERARKKAELVRLARELGENP